MATRRKAEIDKAFNALVKNAFDFLNVAVSEFSTSPKYSVVHFCSAAEMLLKARLLREHWTLVVQRPEQASWAAFLAGEFVSVTIDECRTRLREISGEHVDDASFAALKKLSRHRNKAIHFFHAGVDGNRAARLAIVSEQSQAWFYLHRLLLKWSEHFKKFQKEISAADAAMKRHRQYLITKFDTIKDELPTGALGKCSVCALPAAIPEWFDDSVSLVSCAVCDHREVWVEVDCPACSKAAQLRGEGYSRCTECGHQFDPDELVSFLINEEDRHHAIKDGDDQFGPHNCGFCDGYHVVVQAGPKYVCAACFDISDRIEQCQWCAEYSTGDMEHSYYSGCGICSGYADHVKDD